jgi:hypothetical protein
MDFSSLASGLVTAKAAQRQTSIAARVMKMNAAAEGAVADLLRATDDTGRAAAAQGTGKLTGKFLDIKA